MKNKQLLPIPAILFLLFAASCHSVKQPEFKGVENVRLDKLAADETILLMDIAYFNPNKSKLKFRNAEGDAWIEGTSLGHFIIDSSITIQPNAPFRLPVKLQVDMSKVLRNTLTLLLHPEVMVKVQGTARVGKSGFFIRYPFNYEGKQDMSGLLRNIQ